MINFFKALFLFIKLYFNNRTILLIIFKNEDKFIEFIKYKGEDDYYYSLELLGFNEKEIRLMKKIDFRSIVDNYHNFNEFIEKR